MRTRQTPSPAVLVLVALLAACTSGCNAYIEWRLVGRWLVTGYNWGHGKVDLKAANEQIELRFLPGGTLQTIRNSVPWSTHRYDVGRRSTGWLAGHRSLRIARPDDRSPNDPDVSRVSFIHGDHLVAFEGREKVVLHWPCCDGGSITLTPIPDE